ncbi:MAG: hypothetical protein DSY32_00190 [Aquifex sp.]|nr:MAG: hypothetical protein DSY32_00190 [Aquifex sp.]
MKEILFILGVVMISLLAGRAIKRLIEKRMEGKEVREMENGVIYFYSPSCSVCRAINGEVEKLKHMVNLIEVNVEENKELAKEYGVLGVPAFLIVEKGRVKKAFLGTKGLDYIKRGGEL